MSKEEKPEEITTETYKMSKLHIIKAKIENIKIFGDPIIEFEA